MNLPQGYMVFSREILDKWMGAGICNVTAELVEVPLYSYYIKFAVQLIPVPVKSATVYYNLNSEYIRELVSGKADMIAFIVHEDHI